MLTRIIHRFSTEGPGLSGLVGLLFFLLTACSSGVRTGADLLFDPPYQEWIQGKRIGLVTNQTGVNSQLIPTYQRLQDDPEVRLMVVFTPEHGFEGSAQAGEKILSGGKFVSLYGDQRAPTEADLRDLDLLVYDIQDVGARFYTYISTLFAVLKAAGSTGVPVVVLDRPSPIRGDRTEGPVLESSFESFVGTFRIPIRYGLTVGELAHLFNKEANLQAQLRVVPMRGWRRDLWFDETELVWVPPSPNMPTLQTALVYPGMCLVEGTNLSEGRGTTRPFELAGAPWLDHVELATRLAKRKLPGVRFRPQSFQPTFSKYEGETCRGVQLHVIDRDRFQPVETAIHLLVEIRRLHPADFQFNSGFDRLAGNAWIREQISAGTEAEEIIRQWEQQTRDFVGLRQGYLAY